jgi:hypothetical protein
VSRRITHQAALPADLLDREVPGWRQALADGDFAGDDADDPRMVEAIGSLVDDRVDLAEPDACDDFEISSMFIAAPSTSSTGAAG